MLQHSQQPCGSCLPRTSYPGRVRNWTPSFSCPSSPQIKTNKLAWPKKTLTHKWHSRPELCSIPTWKKAFCLLNEPKENNCVLFSTQDPIADLKSASKELEITSGADIKAECSHTAWAGVQYFVPVSNLQKPLSPPGASYVTPSLSTDKYLLSLKGLFENNCPTIC